MRSNVLIVLSSVLLVNARLTAGECAAGDSLVTGGVYAFTVHGVDGRDVDLAEYKGHVSLIVNVATRCGFTPQLEGLERLYKRYRDDGFVVLGFPANNFMNQAPGSDEQILEFCTRDFSVTFPLFSKISVKGDNRHPLYDYLSSKETNPEFGGEITWNFNKFLIDRAGRVVDRFGSATNPDSPSVAQAIEAALKR
ncbi:glutathione peroxidase [Candidatus Fermentibacteria bacterium]|nr:glutathione peroxidase [Candidatus Fermentibacteria bacterium]